MAEMDTYLAVDNAVDQLERAPSTVQETHKLKSLRTGFRNMSMLLREYDGQEHDPEVAEWLHSIRNIAYKTQQVIGSILVEVNDLEKRSKFGRLLSGGKTCKHEGEIQGIEARIKKICSFNGSIRFNPDEVVGFKDSLETLIPRIIDNTRSQLEVILIFGMAGSGKTTLAKMVYNDKIIKKHFECQEWVFYPQELSLEEFLCRTLSQVVESSSNQIEIDGLHKDELKAKLAEYLKGKRYLVVIDNMHKSDELNELISCFPNDSNGSRIMLTSRIPQEESQFSFSYEVKPLDVSQSWQLLSRKVLEGENHPDLEKLGRRMAEKCKGSPRAILALAAILEGVEKTEEMWLEFLKDDFYYKLPNELKLCLLYFGVFPENFEIPAKQIIQMWVAEGLIKQKGSNNVEEIGEQYLNKLISDSLIQEQTRRANGSVKTCTTNSHVHYFCKKKAEEGKLFQVHTDNSSEPKKDIKRMAIHSDSITDVLRSYDCPDAQSFHCFNKNKNTISSVDFKRMLNNFCNPLLLNFGLLELTKIPRELGKMKSLRYLKLKAPYLKRLPSSIVNLHQLETLDLRNSPIVSLPEGIWKLKLLRYLYLKGPTSLPKTQGIDYYRALPNLHTLSGAIPNKDLRWLMVRAKFPNVTKLRICCTSSELSYFFLNSLDHLYHLQSLKIENPTELPDQNAFPLNLTKLTLFKTKLDSIYIKTLEKLPNLRILKLLEKSICGEEIECSVGGFSQLQVFLVENLDVKKLTTIGAMQCVKCFVIIGCDKMEIPDNLSKIARFSKSYPSARCTQGIFGRNAQCTTR